jgi:glucan phosphoethanolaminetransferase (alkaline phosphatase superfamily)
MRSLRLFGPGCVALALLVPNLFAIVDRSAIPTPWLSSGSSFVTAPLSAAHGALLLMGLTIGLIGGALAVYRWALARRILHLLLFFILLELFYRLAYGGAVSPGLLRSVPETSKRETVELLAGHQALTVSLSLVALLAIFALITSWNSNFNISVRRGIQTAVVSMVMIGTSLVIGLMQFPDTATLKRVVLDELRSAFPFDVATAFAAVGTDWTHARGEAATRAAFRFSNAHRLVSPSAQPAREIYVVMVGETSRRINWSLFGYARATTPRLDAVATDLILFPRMTSNATNTILSLPLTLTRAAPQSRSVARAEKSIITLLKQAGFKTFWISNQERSPLDSNPISQIASEADQISYPDDAQQAGIDDRFDSNLLTRLKREVARLAPDAKAVFFLHMEGSHFGYKERYPADFQHFADGLGSARKLSGRAMQLVDEYDNSVTFTDYNVRSVIDFLAACRCEAGLIYFSDHGERLFDNGVGDEGFGHGFPTISRQEIEIPFFLWLSNSYQTANPLQLASLKLHANSAAQLHNLFETIVDLTGVDYDGRDSTLSLFSPHWEPPNYLTVLNLEESAVTLPVHSAPHEP